MPDLSLASFNTHYGLRSSRRAHPRTFDMRAALGSLDADVVVVQELWRPDAHRGAVDDAAGVLGYDLVYEPTSAATLGPHWPHLVPTGEGESGIAVLSRLPVRRIGSLTLGPTPGDPAPVRTALDVEVDVGPRRLRLVAVHLTSRLPHGPVLQLRRLAGQLPSIGTPTVIVGDCNFWGPGVVGLLRGWRRTVRGRTWPSRLPHSQIDHILIRGDDGIRASGGRVLPGVGSDHLPVRVDLSLA
ncbi:MAG TPA: endonuclease/exonuclease/phosphatase family protein [Acidimicrobiia bacterium]|nr:endonuclease/exonuclease/phosphatase family protein [Acidimicrobiia bacterium]